MTGGRVRPLLGRWARFGGAVFAGLAAALVTAAPAAAHGADAPDGINYRTAVGSVTPARTGLAVRTVEAGARLELTNRTGRTIEVLGYAGEPYLDLRPDGVYENVHSPATYLNRTLAGDTVPPAEADPTRPPSWRRVTAGPSVRWHDHRTHWMSATPPPQVATAPERVHRVRDWLVPLRDGLTPIEVRGTLDWLPPPDPVRWWLTVVLGALGVAALGWYRPDSPAGQRVGPVLAGLALAGGFGAVALAVARVVDTGPADAGDLLWILLTGPTWAVLAGLGTLAAAGHALARRPAADFTLALSGACLALFAGAGNASAFTTSVPPIAGPAALTRVAVLAVVVAGAGLALAGVLRLHAATRSATRAGAEAGRGPGSESGSRSGSGSGGEFDSVSGAARRDPGGSSGTSHGSSGAPGKNPGHDVENQAPAST